MSEMVISFTQVSSKSTFYVLRNRLDDGFFQTDVSERYPPSSLLEEASVEDPDRPGVPGGGWGDTPRLAYEPFCDRKVDACAPAQGTQLQMAPVDLRTNGPSAERV